MSVISKDLASKIATKITEKSRKHYELLKEEYEKMVLKMYLETIPAEVNQLFKKYPDYFQTASSVYIDGKGFNREMVSVKCSVINNSGNYYTIFNPTSKESDVLVAAKRKHEDALDKYKKLKEETNQALLTLKTYNNIRKELPEVADLLPPPISNALVCNFASLKTKLKKQPEAKTLQTQTN